jgi:hypothetical protein
MASRRKSHIEINNYDASGQAMRWTLLKKIFQYSPSLSNTFFMIRPKIIYVTMIIINIVRCIIFNIKNLLQHIITIYVEKRMIPFTSINNERQINNLYFTSYSTIPDNSNKIIFHQVFLNAPMAFYYHHMKKALFQHLL